MPLEIIMASLGVASLIISVYTLLRSWTTRDAERDIQITIKDKSGETTEFMVDRENIPRIVDFLQKMTKDFELPETQDEADRVREQTTENHT
jgi:hypothetical protein